MARAISKPCRPPCNRFPKENTQRIFIFVKNGVYKEKIRVDASFITLRGESRKETRIEFSQRDDDFASNPDQIGQAVVNLRATDFVLDHITIKNTAGVVGPHAMALYGMICDRTVTLDSDVLSEGADTVSLWQGDDGRYYHARCSFRGSVDSVCPRGWCYATDCTFSEASRSAVTWHDGSRNKDQKFVLRNCTFDRGVDGYMLGATSPRCGICFISIAPSPKTSPTIPPTACFIPPTAARPPKPTKRTTSNMIPPTSGASVTTSSIPIATGVMISSG